ncbi:hypothetical protein EBR43_02005 [bacterium]|nr:hypothetical protein [bacterium]NBX72497.1 hypothetical protein [bacterium]
MINHAIKAASCFQAMPQWGIACIINNQQFLSLSINHLCVKIDSNKSSFISDNNAINKTK